MAGVLQHLWSAYSTGAEKSQIAHPYATKVALSNGTHRILGAPAPLQPREDNTERCGTIRMHVA